MLWTYSVYSPGHVMNHGMKENLMNQSIIKYLWMFFIVWSLYPVIKLPCSEVIKNKYIKHWNYFGTWYYMIRQTDLKWTRNFDLNKLIPEINKLLPLQKKNLGRLLMKFKYIVTHLLVYPVIFEANYFYEINWYIKKGYVYFKLSFHFVY